MPTRVTPLVNGQYYHLYNRGTAYQPTFSTVKDYGRFLLCLSYYRFNNLPFRLSRLLQLPSDERRSTQVALETTNELLVELVAFCLMPNHFHLLVEQKQENGISKFIKLLIDSYTRYFNTKHQRVGPLFQGAFKAVRIETTEQLVHVSRYIHLNPLTSYVVKEKDFSSYPWSSLKNYLTKDSKLVNARIILSSFKSEEDYLKFVMDQADYGKELEKIKHLTFEK